ncbi:PqqD family protein [Cyclobacteriaceae bacterium]|nr:PqqD family protein [Cyclobacteriaceae bacterium]
MKFVQNKEILTTELDDSLMMMSIQAGKYFELNPVSKRIWELVESPQSEAEIVKQLLDEFDVSEEQCKQEVAEHLSILKAKHILLIEE